MCHELPTLSKYATCMSQIKSKNFNLIRKKINTQGSQKGCTGHLTDIKLNE